MRASSFQQKMISDLMTQKNIQWPDIPEELRSIYREHLADWQASEVIRWLREKRDA